MSATSENAKLSDKAFWDQEWRAERRANPDAFVFGPLLEKFLPRGGSYLEVGCAPGTTLVYFQRHFGYHVAGLDYSSIDVIEDTLASHGVNDAQILEADFTEFSTDQRFDVVASYGFVEHFTDYPEVIRRHASLVAPGGHLVIEVPNLRFFNYWLYRLMNPALLAIHNLTCMSPRALREAMGPVEDFEIVHCDYYKSCFLFFNQDSAELASRPLIKNAFTWLRRAAAALGLEELPNRYFSPYLIMIARRRG